MMEARQEPHGAHTGVIVSTLQDAAKLNLLLGEGAWAYEFGYSMCGRRLSGVLMLVKPPVSFEDWAEEWINDDLLTCLTPAAYERFTIKIDGTSEHDRVGSKRI
jgi:hypothetical protein